MNYTRTRRDLRVRALFCADRNSASMMMMMKMAAKTTIRGKNNTITTTTPTATIASKQHNDYIGVDDALVKWVILCESYCTPYGCTNLRPIFALLSFMLEWSFTISHTHTHTSAVLFFGYAKLFSNKIWFYFISHTVYLPVKLAWLFGNFGFGHLLKMFNSSSNKNYVQDERKELLCGPSKWSSMC